MAKKVTLHDIAIAANVADSTASKALTGTGRISAETRRRVRDIAAQFGYARPAVKTRTGNGRTGLIGIVTPDRNGRFALPLLAGAARALGAPNPAALLMISQGVPALERSHINQLSAQGVDGLIIAGNTCNARHPIDPRIQNGLPTVYAYDPSDDPADCSLICDNEGAGRQAAEYLLGIGRRRIAIVGGLDFFQATIDRERGALDTLRMAGVAPLLVINDRWSEDWGERAAQLLLERDEMPDAVYCLNDEIARGMCRTLQMHGHRVPQDIAVIGHDNWDSVCVNVHPTLTSFDNELETMGRRAARYLLDAINGRPHHGVFQVESRLVIRESTDETRHDPLHGSGWRAGLE